MRIFDHYRGKYGYRVFTRPSCSTRYRRYVRSMYYVIEEKYDLIVMLPCVI